MTNMSAEAKETRPCVVGFVFEMKYSLLYPQVTKFTTELGYFHDLRRLIIANSVQEAVEILMEYHTDGKPEAIQAELLGSGIARPFFVESK